MYLLLYSLLIYILIGSSVGLTNLDFNFQMLKKKLADRLQSREKTLLDSYEDRLKEVLDKSSNKIAAKLRKAAIMHKRSVAIEEFKLVFFH